MSDIVYYGTSTPSTKGDGKVLVACLICNEPLGNIIPDQFPKHECDVDSILCVNAIEIASPYPNLNNGGPGFDGTFRNGDPYA